jgi:hypothetical protein
VRTNDRAPAQGVMLRMLPRLPASRELVELAVDSAIRAPQLRPAYLRMLVRTMGPPEAQRIRADAELVERAAIGPITDEEERRLPAILGDRIAPAQVTDRNHRDGAALARASGAIFAPAARQTLAEAREQFPDLAPRIDQLIAMLERPNVPTQ